MAAVPAWLWWSLLPGDHDLSQHIDEELPELLAFLDRALAPAGRERRPA